MKNDIISSYKGNFTALCQFEQTEEHVSENRYEFRLEGGLYHLFKENTDLSICSGSEIIKNGKVIHKNKMLKKGDTFSSSKIKGLHNTFQTRTECAFLGRKMCKTCVSFLYGDTSED
jgi:hypothetical protein